MIRTRDFLLYLIVLGFLIVGAVYTGLSERTVSEMREILFTAVPAAPSSTVFTTEETISLDARRAELQARLEAGEGQLADAPPVFVSVDQLALQEQAEATSSLSDFSGARAVQWCSGPLSSPLIARWPTNSQLTTVEGQRVLTSTQREIVQMGSSTETVVTEETFLALPIRTVRTSFASCLTDTLIGVTIGGQPLTNEMAGQFLGAGARQAIGYTRDGFTVFGPLEDDTLLDECGGQYVNGQYQYHVRVSEPFILGCYAGVPTTL